MLNVFGLFCHPRLSSSLILTQRKIISSPPLKSMPSWTMSPSLTGKALLSCEGGLNRMWLRNVPDELLTSLMYHLPSSYQNSQCRRLTTLLLKPTGAPEAEWPDAPARAWVSRSEYRPTRMTSVPLDSVLEMGGKDNDGRVDRGS